MITTVIFDLDGLLADSETLHCKAYQDTLGSLGVTISEAEYAEFWIRRGLGINELYGVGATFHAFHASELNAKSARLAAVSVLGRC